MNLNHVDQVARAVTSRLTRRTALRGFGGGIGLAGLGLHRTTAQDATPSAATPAAGADGEKTFFLFVQTAQAGSFIAKPGEEGVYQVTLTGATAQTVYFSDRPERIVGAVPTVQFLENLGFTPDTSPNAALVTQTDGGEDIVVVELRNPVYSEDFGPEGTVTLTYDVVVLADYQGAGLAHLAARQDDGALPATFGHTSLFIDDCPDIRQCEKGPNFPFSDQNYRTLIGPMPNGPVGTCWRWSEFKCLPCSGRSRKYYHEMCDEAYPECNGRCLAL